MKCQVAFLLYFSSVLLMGSTRHVFASHGESAIVTCVQRDICVWFCAHAHSWTQFAIFPVISRLVLQIICARAHVADCWCNGVSGEAIVNFSLSHPISGQPQISQPQLFTTMHDHRRTGNINATFSIVLLKNCLPGNKRSRCGYRLTGLFYISPHNLVFHWGLANGNDLPFNIRKNN